jgi:hypothetical protein
VNADFLDAHLRHWDDAELLFNSQRWANADHLYGVAAECGLKRLMQKFGMPVDEAGSPTERIDRRHANGIWARYGSYLRGSLGAGYGLPDENPFDNWNVSDRYAHHGDFDQPRAVAHRQGAQRVCDLIAKAQREGLLS